MGDFPSQVQDALTIFDLLPERFDSMAGAYFGKELGPLSVLYDVYDIDDRKIVTFFLMMLNRLKMKHVNAQLDEQRKIEERKRKRNGRQ